MPTVRPWLPDPRLCLSLIRAGKFSVVLSLPLSDSKGAAEFVRRVSDPKDPLYRKYIAPEEFASRFGANAGKLRL